MVEEGAEAVQQNLARAVERPQVRDTRSNDNGGEWLIDPNAQHLSKALAGWGKYSSHLREHFIYFTSGIHVAPSEVLSNLPDLNLSWNDLHCFEFASCHTHVLL